MAIRHLLSLLLLLAASAQAVCQVADTTLVKRIGAVKRDTTCLYAEATLKTAAESSQGARAILEVAVGDWVRAQHPNETIDLCIAKAREHTTEIQTRRGNYYRTFVYVKKGDILPIPRESGMMVFHLDSTAAAPPAAAPSTRSQAPQNTIVMPLSASSSSSTSTATTLTTDEQHMAAITSFHRIEPYVKDLRDANRLESYGKYATLPATGRCYIFVYDEEGRVRAVLRRDDDRQLNLQTLKADDVHSYTHCGAIWIRLKQ